MTALAFNFSDFVRATQDAKKNGDKLSASARLALMFGIENIKPTSRWGKQFAREGVHVTQEFRRIESLPRRKWETDPTLEAATAELNTLLRLPGGEEPCSEHCRCPRALWPNQAAALIELCTVNGLFGPIGVGKGKALITLLAPVVLNAERPVLFVPAQLRDQTLRKVVPMLRKHWRLNGKLRVVGYSELSLAKNKSLLFELQPDLILLDECFPAGTLVKTPAGDRRIEDLREGDKIWSLGLQGVREEVVTKTLRRQAEVLCIVFSSHKVYCTPSHPFLTRRGWIAAERLENGEEVVQAVPRSQPKDARESILLESLRDALANGPAWLRASHEHIKSSSQDGNKLTRDAGGEPRNHATLFRAHATQESDALGENEGESLRDVTGHEASTAQDRRQRAGASAAATALGSGARLADGGLDIARAASQGLSHLLQGGHRERGDENSGRGGWPLTHELCGAGEGSQEGSGAFALGLARVESVERTRSGGHGIACEVHNLEVSGTNTYLIEGGLVVHNCHSVKNAQAARTKRLDEYMKARPQTRVLAVSGSVTKRSLRDYWKLLLWTLKPDLAPLPATWRELSDWADALDEGVPDEQRKGPGALTRLCDENEEPRDGYRKRLVETPGIVATSQSELGVSLRVVEAPVRVPGIVLGHMDRMRTTWETPYGDQISEAVELWRHMRELACGFFYRWDPLPPAEWLAARKAWKSLVRETLKHNRRGLDSELLVSRWFAKLAEEGGGDKTLVGIWREWSEIKGSFKPNTVAEWVDPFALHHGAAWLDESRTMPNGAVAWSEHVAFGERLAEMAGVPYFGAGMKASAAILDCRGPCVVSIAAHQEGKNLQHWSKSLITAPPSSGKTWEQLLGRMHREGQDADEVTYEVWLHADELRASLRQALNDARYIEQTTGARQKLLYASLIAEGIEL